jgi:hypothetical protein
MAAATFNAGHATNAAYDTNNDNDGAIMQLGYDGSRTGRIYDVSKKEETEEDTETQNDEKHQDGDIDDETVHSCVNMMKKEDADAGLVRLAYSIANDLGVTTNITINR